MYSQFEELQPANDWQKNTQVEDYLDHLCTPLVERLSYEEREVIRAEIRSHITGIIDAHIELGSTLTEATTTAIHDFGDPVVIGRSLLREHTTVKAKAQPSYALSVAMNLTIGCAFGGLVCVCIDLVTHQLGLTRNVKVIPDMVTGGCVGWLPALALIRRPQTVRAAAIGTGLFYTGLVSGIMLLNVLASGPAKRHSGSTLLLIGSAIICAGASGTLAGAVMSRVQTAFAHLIPEKIKRRAG